MNTTTCESASPNPGSPCGQIRDITISRRKSRTDLHRGLGCMGARKEAGSWMGCERLPSSCMCLSNSRAPALVPSGPLAPNVRETHGSCIRELIQFVVLFIFCQLLVGCRAHGKETGSQQKNGYRLSDRKSRPKIRKSKFVNRTACVFLWLFSLVSFAVGQQVSPTAAVSVDPSAVRSTVPAIPNQQNRISLDVLVADGAGKPTAGLEPTDFTLLDNSQPRKILGFRRTDGIAGNRYDPPVEVIIVLDAINLPYQAVTLQRLD